MPAEVGRGKAQEIIMIGEKDILIKNYKKSKPRELGVLITLETS